MAIHMKKITNAVFITVLVMFCIVVHQPKTTTIAAGVADVDLDVAVEPTPTGCGSMQNTGVQCTDDSDCCSGRCSQQSKQCSCSAERERCNPDIADSCCEGLVCKPKDVEAFGVKLGAYTSCVRKE